MAEIKALKPQDIVVLLKIVLEKSQDWRQLDLAYELGLSQSEVNQSIKRLNHSKLLFGKDPIRQSVLDFLIHGLKYAFPAEPGPVTRGIPTAHSAEPLSKKIIASESDKYVWPDGKGKVSGHSIIPLYSSVPMAAQKDPKLHQLLALVDALRVGRAREVKLATEYLKKELAGA